MRMGYVVPRGDAPDVVEAARVAEAAGWDGLFVWEAIWGVDAWVCLTAATMVTTRLRLGTMLTPLPRVKPWDLASRASTLDRLSGGRVQLAVGLGAPHEGWTAFERDEGRAERALLLDEGLDVYDGLMRGEPFAYEGRRYVVHPTTFVLPPPPVQRPRVPVWVVGMPGRPRSIGRAARWDGLLPYPGEGVELTPDRVADAVAEVQALRAGAGLSMDGYDVVVEGGANAPADEIAAWEAAGATWWIGSDWDALETGDGARDLVLDRVRAGPPRR